MELILLPVILYALYAAKHGKRIVKEAAVKKDTQQSSDATLRIIIGIVIALFILGALTGGLQT
jgi:hypothetical protein